MTESIFNLPSGRALGYACYGPVTGRPILYFHGTPSSRLEPQLLGSYGMHPEDLLHQAGLRLIAVDRPGIGHSGFNRQGTLLSFARDAALLAAHLQVHRCPVLCWSGGGPYALAMAHQYPELITGAFILCGFTRRFDAGELQKMYGNKWYFQAARRAPGLLTAVLERVRHAHLQHALPRWLTGLPPADYAMMNQPSQLLGMLHTSLKEACRHGAAGPVREAALYFQPFGFQLSEISQPLHYWWGTEDRAVVRSHPAWLAAQAPHCRFYVKKGEGHLSLYVRYFGEALQVIADTYADHGL